jgi:hypothetical protein
MTYHYLDPQTNLDSCEVTLNLQEVKMLHNACVDIVSRHPSMIGYAEVAVKLSNFIIEAEGVVHTDYPF